MLNLILRQDIPKLIEGVEKLSERLGIDAKLLKYVWWAFVLLLLLRLLTWLKKLLWEDYVKPLRATPEEKRRLARRQMFAGFVEGRLRDINSKEEWRDHRFTELEAEVEAEGERQAFTLIPFIKRTRSGLRKEKSLSRAIEQSRERLVQLEGEPGSGKSVALRFVARQLAERAAGSRSLKRPVPLYLNLKEINRKPDEPVDRNLIESFVKQSLTRSNDRDIEKFLEDEFGRGMEEGAWLFLFDSFDEIPEVLSSTEADAAIRGYADAISDFLGGMNRCRGVIASRHFRGPGQSRWPRFRILPLSEERRLRLIRQALLPGEVEQQVKAQLEAAGPEARGMFSNPMLLGLLCEHMKGGNPFPENVHTVLASYLDHRLTRDRERVQRRYGVAPAEVRAAAEAAAFCMAADADLGLSPTRRQLREALRHQHLEAPNNFDDLLDALVFIKLARSEDLNGSREFTFAHRRFQEYFATCVVLCEPDRVSPYALLTDARWRETAVVMCQSQPRQVLAPLIAEARRLVAEAAAAIAPPRAGADGGHEKEAGTINRITWPAGSLHVLSLLQDGFRRRLNDLPADIRGRVGRILRAVSTEGGLYDRKCALEVAGVAPEQALLTLLRKSFRSGSAVLKNVAYRQVAGLGKIPRDVAAAIHRAVHTLAVTGQLHRARLATRAHLSRLENPEPYLDTLRLLLALPSVDLVLHLAAALGLGALRVARGGGGAETAADTPTLGAALILLAVSHLSLRLIFYGRPPFRLRGVRLVHRLSRLALVCVFLFPAAYGIYSRRPGGLSTGLLLLCAGLAAYVALWSSSAKRAAREGWPTALRWWPVLPLIPLARVLAVVALLVLWVFVVMPLDIFRDIKEGVRQRETVQWWSKVLWRLVRSMSLRQFGVIVTLGLLLLLSLPLVLLALLVASVREWRHWRRWQRAAPGAMSGMEFVSEAGHYLTSHYFARYVRAVRTRELLTADEEGDELVERLSLKTEAETDPLLVGFLSGELPDDFVSAALQFLPSATPRTLRELEGWRWRPLPTAREAGGAIRTLLSKSSSMYDGALKEEHVRAHAALVPWIFVAAVREIASPREVRALRCAREFDDWFQETFGRSLLFRGHGMEPLDELVLLLEQVRARRQGTAGAGVAPDAFAPPGRSPAVLTGL
jgi:hypothetical protein